MIFRRFRIKIIINISLLTLEIMVLCWVVFFTQFKLSGVIIFLIIAMQTANLIKYVETVTRDFTLFLESIKYSDVSQSYSRKGMGETFDKLYETFTEANTEFRKARLKTEENYRYLQTVFQHVPVGLISFYPDGQVDLINSAAKNIHRVHRLSNILQLKKISKELCDCMLSLYAGEKKLLKIEHEGETMQIMLYVTKIKLREKEFTIASMQNIRGELEEKEVESWQKLIRILTHEIMNSITPIASLTSTINDIIRINFIEAESAPVDKDNMEDLDSALESIKKRSEGLLHFVTNYRNLALIPKPKKEHFEVKELFKRVSRLMKADMKKKKITFTVTVKPENLVLYADPNQIEQVLINLILNSMNAVGKIKTPEIRMTAELDDKSRLFIEVRDNGTGIPPDSKEQIFLPFFSTRAGGSGIGLSLSKQITTLHGASINFYSNPGKETSFKITF